MEIKDIYELWDRFDSSCATKMSLDYQGLHFELCKEQNTQPVSQPVKSVESVIENPEPVADGKEIKAPLVGVFYRSPAPGEKPFVEVGQTFQKGDVIGIIEAMKMMNEIVAPEDGIVEDILVQDAALVEYHQAILTYR